MIKRNFFNFLIPLFTGIMITIIRRLKELKVHPAALPKHEKLFSLYGDEK